MVDYSKRWPFTHHVVGGRARCHRCSRKEEYKAPAKEGLVHSWGLFLSETPVVSRLL